MMFCTKCGNSLSSDATFCNKCGHQLNGTSPIPRPTNHETAMPPTKTTQRRPKRLVSEAIGFALFIGIVVLAVNLFASAESKIVGQWRLQTSEGLGVVVTTFTASEFQFYKNGTGIMTYEAVLGIRETDSFTWHIKDGRITISGETLDFDISWNRKQLQFYYNLSKTQSATYRRID